MEFPPLKEGRGGLEGENPGPVPVSLPESAQTLAGIASRAARKSGKNFQQGQDLPENPPSSKEFLDSHTRQVYTLARKDYIHKCLFLELISRNITFQLHENIFLELITRKLHYTYSFATQRVTWKNVPGIFLDNLISVA